MRSEVANWRLADSLALSPPLYRSVDSGQVDAVEGVSKVGVRAREPPVSHFWHTQSSEYALEADTNFFFIYIYYFMSHQPLIYGQLYLDFSQ